ncbi:hypothetical protein P7K49_007488, partial [Saguinus oedipus]
LQCSGRSRGLISMVFTSHVASSHFPGAKMQTEALCQFTHGTRSYQGGQTGPHGAIGLASFCREGSSKVENTNRLWTALAPHQSEAQGLELQQE